MGNVDIEELCDVIRQILIGHNLHNMINEGDECGYSLADALTMDGQTVDKGYEEIHLIVDALFHPIKDYLNQCGLIGQSMPIERIEDKELMYLHKDNKIYECRVIGEVKPEFRR
ncbi:MAG: hypothetical protein COB09_18980 [Thalassobium sp.]|nr:MAG: hypothetical protein COB09_18980 [Thalassobium sp.]